VARYPTEHENSIPHTRLHHTREILDAIFYLLSRVAALGDYCRTTQNTLEDRPPLLLLQNLELREGT
jgi:hypothetical protein